MNFPHPPNRRSFASGTHAAEHLCDHVLTRPEAHDWSLVLPPYCGLVSPTDDPALEALARSLFSDSPARSGQVLLGLYVDALLLAIDDALRLGFWWEQRDGKYREWHGLGLDGTFIIWDTKVIKTGFLFRNVRWPPPGQPRPRLAVPLPRRNLAERLPAPKPNTMRQRYELFRTSHYCVSKEYGAAYDNIRQAGGDIFVDPLKTPRFNRWQQWLESRPGDTRDREESP
jgi:hypothetical protein